MPDRKDPAQEKRIQRVSDELAHAGITTIHTADGRVELVSLAWYRMMAIRVLRALDPSVEVKDDRGTEERS